MSSPVGLPEALERAASALPEDADAIRPANGDPVQLSRVLDAAASQRVLAWLLANEPHAGEELAEAWAEDPEGAGRNVLAIDPEGLPKVARKAMRRVLHRLRSRGVALPEAERPARTVATLPPVGDTLEEARVSPLDPRGARVVYLALDHPGGGVRLFEVVLDDLHGVLGFEVYSSGRSRIRRFLREFERAGARRAAPTPPDAVRALIARAVETQPASRPLPRGFREWRSRLTAVGDDARTPGRIVRDALGATAAALDPDPALARAQAWVQAGSIGPWPPEPERARDAAEKIADAGKGVLVVSEGTRLEQVERALDEAVGSLFDEAFREVTARRFEESAYVMWRTAGEEDAAAALRAADLFREREPGDNPLARALLEVLFAPVLEQARADPDAGPGEDDAPVQGGG